MRTGTVADRTGTASFWAAPPETVVVRRTLKSPTGEPGSMAQHRLPVRRSLLDVVGGLLSIAYMSPGNWARNITGEGRYGTAVPWVVVPSSLVATVDQISTTKLGIPVGEAITRRCRDRFPQPLVYVPGGHRARDGRDRPRRDSRALPVLLLGARSTHQQGYRAFERPIAGVASSAARPCSNRFSPCPMRAPTPPSVGDTRRTDARG